MKIKTCFQFREAKAWVKIVWKRVRWRGWDGEMKRKRDRGTKRKKEKQSKRDLEEVLIVFPWCFEEDLGLKASEQKAVGVPIVPATKPDPLAHTNLCTHTRAHARGGSFRVWHQQLGMQSGKGGGQVDWDQKALSLGGVMMRKREWRKGEEKSGQLL